MLRSFSGLNLQEAMLMVPAENAEQWTLPNAPVEPSPILMECLSRIQVFDLTNSELSKLLLIDTIFAEVVPHHPPLKIWKGEPLTSDTLGGITDYLFAPKRMYAATPLLCVAEAKKDDFVQGRAQCIGEMVACRWNNKQASREIDIYGIVSNGQDWQFYKLTTQNAVWETEIYPIKNLPELLGVLHFVCAECAKNAA